MVNIVSYSQVANSSVSLFKHVTRSLHSVVAFDAIHFFVYFYAECPNKQPLARFERKERKMDKPGLNEMKEESKELGLFGLP